MTDFYRTSQVQITDSIASVGGHNYTLRNITSYRHSLQVRSRIGDYALLASAAFFGLLALGNLFAGETDGFFVGLFLATALGVPGYLFFRRPLRMHHLILVTASGEVRAYSSRDGDEVSNVAAALGRALSAFR